MNATVTRTSAKSTNTRGAKKMATGTAAPPKAKTASGRIDASVVKTATRKPAKTLTATLKTSTKTTPAKAVAKAPGTTVKSKPAAKTARKSAAKTSTEKRPVPAATRTGTDKSPAPKTGKGATSLKSVIDIPASRIRSKERSGSSMSGNNGRAGLTDTMEKSAVSKVSEVATKTTKSTPAAPAEGNLLTEAQILKMSDKDYMNEAQLAFFKARLQQLERDLLKNAGETTEHLRETVLVPDPADRATIEEEHALELRTRDRERKLLKKVQQSIASIDSGEYGWCEETGEPIGIPRLLARPTATLSLEAQQRRELKQKLYGD
jgi:DnaK suppressor protein